MPKLSTSARKELKKSDYGIPAKVGKGGKNEAGKGAYPMPDKSHAVNAKARASQQVAKGNLSKSAQKQINAKANKIIKSKGGK